MRAVSPAFLALSLFVLPAAGQSLQGTPSAPHQGSSPTTRHVRWIADFGSPDAENAAAAAEMRNGDFLISGQSFSAGAPEGDAWVVRMNRLGNVRWQYTLGGAGRDRLSAALGTADGGALLAGYTGSFGAGDLDGWIVKLTRTGAIEWQRTYGTADEEQFTSLAAAPNGFFVGGARSSASEPSAVWVLRIDALGSVLWQKEFSGKGNDVLASLAATPTGLVFVANSSSALGGAGVAFARPWIVALDGEGDVSWQKTYDFSSGDLLSHIVPLEDGGFVLTGEILSFAFLRGDLWVVRLDALGEVVWDQRMGDHFGNFWYDGGSQVQPTSDGGFLVAGNTATAKPVIEDLWLVKLSSTGAREWDRTLGGPLPDFANALIPARNGGFFLAGSTGGGNALGVRLAETGFTSSDCGLSGPTSPNEWTSTLTVETAVSAEVPTAVAPLDSSAVRVAVPNTGSFLCAPN